MSINKEKIRVGLAQVNLTVGDLEGNSGKIRETISLAEEKGVHILAFPELSLCGYPPEDLLLKPAFLEDCQYNLEKLAGGVKDITVLMGCPQPPSSPGGKPYNTCRVLRNGKVAGSYRKIMLPNYGVFDEMRYFSPGEKAVVLIMGADKSSGRIRVGINICEDIWMDDGPTPSQVVDGGAGIIINISASPYHRGKCRQREELMQRRAAENRCYLCYVNPVGGQDELVFDGSSVIVSPSGETIARAGAFQEKLLITDLDLSRQIPEEMDSARRASTGFPVELIELPALPEQKAGFSPSSPLPSYPDELDELYTALTLGTRDYVNKNGFEGVVLGLSGGIDSALTAVIAVDALGAERVSAVSMPSEYSSPNSSDDASTLAQNLNINMITLPIQNIYHSYLESLRDILESGEVTVTEENIQARIRGNLLMALSNRYGWLVLTTGNKSELAVGYCTLYGDMAGGFAVLKDVPKTLVYRLSRHRNSRGDQPVIPPSIIDRKPSAELKPDQYDQDTLPPYDILDSIIEKYVEEDMSMDEIISGHLPGDTVQRVITMIDSNEYKRRQAPPGIKITPKAFGRDRRLPITNRYRQS